MRTSAKEAQSPCHLAQCYGTDGDALIRNVARFLAEGYAQREGGLIIATAARSAAILAEATRQGADLDQAARDGRLGTYDAHTVLAHIVVDSQPDQARFEAVIGEALDGLRGEHDARGVRIYGEMVGLLWQEWRFTAALRLEEYWNDLLSRERVSLFCGYPIDVFGLEFDPELMHGLLCAHSALLPTTGKLEDAVHRAMTDVLGPQVEGHWPRIRGDARWGTVPSAEATVLWLRANLPHGSELILRQARELWRAANAA
jgi:hypothetical protein